ncbi:MAG: exo-alpha-sialidase [Anaerolineae bacterium]|jgi:hypothetical protein|nr:exo-alpha-sialidase [Anaerolineae bacterium]
MKRASEIYHQTIYKDEYSYCAHPHIRKLLDGSWLLVFNRSVRRTFILHPPEDPHYYNLTMRSHDEGRSWEAPQVTPGYDWYGVECAGLTSLSNGAVLLNQWRFRWFPLATAKKLSKHMSMVFPEDRVSVMKQSDETNEPINLPEELADLVPWGRSNGGTYVHRSTNFGMTWDEAVEVDTLPLSGGYGMRGAVELCNGDILLPLSDVPHYKKIFVVRSSDGGHSWGPPLLVANEADKEFEEPCAILLPDDSILMLLRENKSHYLYQTESRDGGWSWSKPMKTPIWGYPADLLLFHDDLLFCVYGYRKQPFGIHATISYDMGKSWEMDNTWVVRDGFPNRDLGYPSSVLMTDGSIYVVYYGQDTNGITGIHGTKLRVEV